MLTAFGIGKELQQLVVEINDQSHKAVENIRKNGVILDEKFKLPKKEPKHQGHESIFA